MMPPENTDFTRIDAVVIGGSAGAIDALGTLLPCLPRGMRAAVLIVVHLPSARPSLLAEIFAARCARPVLEAEDKMPIVGGSVYFAPPNYHMLIEHGGQIALSADEMVHFSRPAIDVLFESAADEYAERLLGVLLSGANRDGAAGIATIARAGGITVVQSPESSFTPEMSRAALKVSVPDYVVSVEEMAALFSKLGPT